MAAVREDARKLAAELPDLMPDDPAMAAALEEAMAQAFAEGIGENNFLSGRAADKPTAGDVSGTSKAGGEAALPNEDQARGKTTPESNSGSFAPSGGGSDEDGGVEGEKKGDSGKEPEKSLRERAAEVKPEEIAEIVSGRSPVLVEPHVGLAVILSDPMFKDASGRELRFSQDMVPKYSSGWTRPYNKEDVERFRLVGRAIYAAAHDEGGTLTYEGRLLPRNTAFPPRGAQRLYKTDSDAGQILWAFTYADERKVRSIQNRDKNDPPYKTRRGQVL